jgi:subtilase family serine protease
VRTTSRVLVAALGGVTALALAAGSAGAATPTPGATVEVAGGATSTIGFAVGAAVPATDTVSLVIDLAFTDEPAAEAAAIAAATAGSPTYGHFLTSTQFDARYGPRPAGVAALRGWLHRSGLTVDSAVGDQALVVHGPAARVSAAFGGVALQTATTRETSGAAATGVLTTGRLRVPAALAGVVDSIGGLSGPTPAAVTDSYVSDPHPQVQTSGAVTATTTPPCATYFGQVPLAAPKPLPFAAKLSSAQECSYFPGVGTYYTAANTAKLRKLDYFDPRYLGQGTTVGIVLWGNDTDAIVAANLQARMNGVASLRSGQYSAQVTRTRMSGCVAAGTDAYLEQNLDIQALRVMAPAASIRYYADARCQTPELSLARAVAQDKVQVLTNSWGYPNYEYDPDDPDSNLYALGNIVHKALIKAAAEGITVLFSSGDSGSGVLARTARHAAPGYPASDPLAVAVGGVGFGTDSAGEPAFRSGWTDGYFVYGGGRWHRVNPAEAFGPDAIGSSGGVSHVWAAPVWQKKAHVAVRGKRVVPDLANSADGVFDPFLVVQFSGGAADPEAVAGTSVASPLTAGQVAGAVVADGHRRLGLITPALYAGRRKGVVSDVFFRQDAVGGKSETGQFVLYGEELPSETLRTKPGWDDVTGLGTPGPRFYQLIAK